MVSWAIITSNFCVDRLPVNQSALTGPLCPPCADSAHDLLRMTGSMKHTAGAMALNKGRKERLN